jgi:succinylglutamate desuccinylase
MNRIIGEFDRGVPGPLVVLMGGIHGNETEGIAAIEGVFLELSQGNYPIHGKVLGLRGNLPAIAAKRRFIDYDLNRCWREEHLPYLLKNKGKLHKVEDHEALAVLEILEYYLQTRYSQKVLVDLHATSSNKGSFVIIPEYYADHPLVKNLQRPVVLNLEGYLKGTLLNYACERGMISFAFEGGLIGSRKAQEIHTAGIWEILQTAGTILPQSSDKFTAYRNLLYRQAQGLPEIVHVIGVHWVHEGDQFSMQPGYENFTPVKKDEILAYDKRGPVKAPCDGMIFMPLYQQQGNDGFFMVESVKK